MPDEVKPDGWHPWPLFESHVMRDALYMGGRAVAIVEAFSDSGPWYANAITPQGERERLGPDPSLVGSIAWAEQVTGYRVKPPAEGRAD